MNDCPSILCSKLIEEATEHHEIKFVKSCGGVIATGEFESGVRLTKLIELVANECATIAASVLPDAQADLVVAEIKSRFWCNPPQKTACRSEKHAS